MIVFLSAITCVLLSVCAQFLLKTGMSTDTVQQGLSQNINHRVILTIFLNRYIVAGFGLYVLSAVAWLGVLSAWDVSKAYPIVGLGFALTVLGGWYAGEAISLGRVIGIAFICAGVVLVGRS